MTSTASPLTLIGIGGGIGITPTLTSAQAAPGPYHYPDLTLPPAVILMNLINEINIATLPAPLTAGVCVFGDPTPYGSDGFNSQIPFGTTAPWIFGSGQVNIKYNRVDVTLIIDAGQPATAATMMSGALATLNSTYALNMQASDIIDSPIADGVGTLQMNPASMIYTGNLQLTFSASNVAPAPVPAPPSQAYPLSAYFSAYVDTVNQLKVHFSDTSDDGSGVINQWIWTFGDGSPASNVEDPVHTYAAFGNYQVSLTVTDSNNNTSTVTLPVNVPNNTNLYPPQVTFTTAINGLTVTFTDTSKDANQINGWSWNFGDGTTNGNTQIVAHTYAASGVYWVSLTINDITGSYMSVLTSIIVS